MHPIGDTMQVEFSKMQAVGNDFVIINNIDRKIQLNKEQIKNLANRNLGVGCDQVLLVENPNQPDVDFFYRIFNADGTEVGQCGNGVRCLTRFLISKKLSDKNTLRIATKTRFMIVEYESDTRIAVNMGKPNFTPSDIPIQTPDQAAYYTLRLKQGTLEFGAVSMGNPHAVIKTPIFNARSINTIGKTLNQHPFFPEGVNVGFMQVVSPTQIKLHVYERGVGETRACGSAACAAVAVGKVWELLADEVNVVLPGGELEICWPGGEEDLWLIGPATEVFTGTIQI